MARTRRAQILFEPEEYACLEEAARRRGISVSELVRRTVGERYLGNREKRRSAVEAIRAMKIPLPNWSELEEEILDARSDVVS